MIKMSWEDILKDDEYKSYTSRIEEVEEEIKTGKSLRRSKEWREADSTRKLEMKRKYIRDLNEKRNEIIRELKRDFKAAIEGYEAME